QMHGAYNQLIRELEELEEEDLDADRRFVRMDVATFRRLEALVTPLIKRQDTVLREAIPAGDRLAVTLRFLASGKSYASLEREFRISSPTIGFFVPVVCQAIFTVLCSDYLKMPESESQWEQVSEEFGRRWNVPHCCGAVAGKHVALNVLECSSERSSDSGKQFYPVVLYAVVDADYNFIYVDVERSGRLSDAKVFANSSLCSALENNTVNLPPPSPLPGRLPDVPYFLVGDETFPLKPYLMRAYPGRGLDPRERIFNFRLSRARQVVDNVFGIMTERFAVLRKPMCIKPERVAKVVLACCALHNMLRAETAKRLYSPPGDVNSEDPVTHDIVPGDCAQPTGDGLKPLPREEWRSTRIAHDARDELCDYFSTNGVVDWQWDLAGVK
ncbi:hypothetical protein BaRGS_00007019, partial [Batillaria attramentaria]